MRPLIIKMGYVTLTPEDFKNKQQKSIDRWKFRINQVLEQEDTERAIQLEEHLKKLNNPTYVSFLDGKTQDEKDLLLMIEAGKRLSELRLSLTRNDASSV